MFPFAVNNTPSTSQFLLGFSPSYKKDPTFSQMHVSLQVLKHIHTLPANTEITKKWLIYEEAMVNSVLLDDNTPNRIKLTVRISLQLD